MDTYQHLSDVVFVMDGIKCQHTAFALACTWAHIGPDANDSNALELFRFVQCSVLIMSSIVFLMVITSQPRLACANNKDRAATTLAEIGTSGPLTYGRAP